MGDQLPPAACTPEPSEPVTRTEFEALLADIFARFVDLPSEDVDLEIIAIQRRLCAFLGLKRSSLWQAAPDGSGKMLLTHLHQPPEAPPAPENADVHDYFPWCAGELKRGNTLRIRRMSDLPPEAARDRAVWERYGTKSTLIFPLSVGGGPVIGMLSLADSHRERDWPDLIVDRCRLVAQVVANALARKRSDGALRESEQRYRVLFDSAPVGIVWIGMDGCVKAANPAQARMFGYASPQELLGCYTPMLVAEEDRERSAANLRGQLAGQDVPPRRYLLVRRDGSKFVGEVTSEVLRGPHQEVQGYLCATRDITALVEAQETLSQTVEELHRLKEQLQHENVYLRQEVQTLHGEMPIVGDSAPLRLVISQAQQVAATNSTVLLLGETGTGKELLAQHLHRIGRRSTKPFVTLNIAAIPSTLLESELFGREKGAYTGALTRQAGRFELADGGTLFLDEIGEMPLETQAKLLRVLQEGEFERLGSSRTLRVNVQLIAATNRVLPELVREGKFRQDLYYRLNIFPITLPPLRERPEDIPLLIAAFVREFSDKMGKRVERVRKSDLEALQNYSWPGNVRELRNVIERSMIMADGPALHLVLPEADSVPGLRGSRLLRDVERLHVEEVIKSTGGRIYGPRGAAQILGVKPTTLYALMDRLGIRRRTQA